MSSVVSLYPKWAKISLYSDSFAVLLRVDDAFTFVAYVRSQRKRTYVLTDMRVTYSHNMLIFPGMAGREIRNGEEGMGRW